MREEIMRPKPEVTDKNIGPFYDVFKYPMDMSESD
jgi:hypothetical protein